MNIMKTLIVALGVTSLVAACGGEKKEEPAKTPDKTETDKTVTPTTTTPATPTAPGKGLGALGGLLGGACGATRRS